eukprot:5965531-Heterocapsa_arctica.AAC.1
MEALIPNEKGPTIMFICNLKAEDTNWAESTVKQHICIIIHFLKSNRTEIMKLLRLGAIGLMMEGAKEARMEELHLDHHIMVSPRMKADRNFIISAVVAHDPDQPQERPGFKFFK